MNSVAVECGDNLRLRLMVWITGLQAGDHAHGRLAPAGQRANGGGHRARSVHRVRCHIRT